MKKSVKKPAKKAVKKPVKKAVKVAPKKQAKKPAKKVVRKPRKKMAHILPVPAPAPVKDVAVAPVVDTSGVVVMTPVPDDLLNK